MKVTALEEYGLRCMLRLARSSGHGSVTLPEFASGEGVSIPYAGKLLTILKKARLVKAARGRHGGYELTRLAGQISLKEILDSLGNPVFSSSHCAKYSGENEICVHTDNCTIRSVWRGFEGFIGDVLEKVSLADLAEGKMEIFHELKVEKKTNAR